jgi:hypothetical protein
LNSRALLYTFRETQGVRIFKTKELARFARKEGIGEDALCEAIDRAERGLIDADLGGDLIKQRVARPGQGRSGGYRTVTVWRAGQRSFFVHGFAKNRRANLTSRELKDFQDLGKLLLGYGDGAIDAALAAKELLEVSCG